MLLVDNAAQPMQAAPVAALKSIAVSGNAMKLHLLFTHFDQVQLYLMVQRPVRWEGGEPDDDENQVQEAYVQRGRGSSFTRARIIASDVYDRGAPIPTASASPDQNRFLKDVASLVAEVAEQLDVILE